MSARLLYPSSALILAGGLFASSALPTAAKHALHMQGSLHPYLHLGGFAILAFCLFRASNAPPWRLLLLILLLAFGYATEAFESHQDGWPIEQNDVLLDTIGVLAGACLGQLTIQVARRS